MDVWMGVCGYVYRRMMHWITECIVLFPTDELFLIDLAAHCTLEENAIPDKSAKSLPSFFWAPPPLPLQVAAKSKFALRQYLGKTSCENYVVILSSSRKMHLFTSGCVYEH